MDLQLLVSLAVIHTIALASPGPDFALIVKLSSQENRAVALASALGISTAILCHTLLSLTGLSLLIHSSEQVYLLVQLVGASYLAWMGIGAIRAALSHWRAAVSLESSGQSEAIGIKKGFLQGLYTNLLNPKALVFFITLFSTLITPQVSLVTKGVAAALLFTLSMMWFSFIAMVLTKPKIQIKLKKATPIINLVTGLVFVTVALVIIYGLQF
ncbi:LysE family translocator [Shewanella youngdeokensis]|uniref:LysE family translocator n=1 Tax=Shewanella youngdeokensis TaxID=2999068 RepID=A0ABZ0JUC1_9GAMM|nr:LysE family translocator [Shewanella sp. DAU334]